MVLETISLKEMITDMDRGVIFSIGFRTCDLKKDKGGEYIFFDECVKHAYKTREQLKEERNLPKEKVFKNPKHYENSTRNIKRLSDGSITKIHLRLVRKFNGKTVV